MSNGWGRDFKIGSTQVFSFLLEARLDQVSMLYHSMSLPSDIFPLRNEDDLAEDYTFGVRALVAPANRAMPPGFVRRGVHGRFAVYEAAREGYFGLVDPVARYLGPRDTWFEENQAWLKSPLPSFGQVVLLDERGPALPTVARWAPLPPPRPLSPPGHVLSE
jgi:hypothetical protein